LGVQKYLISISFGLSLYFIALHQIFKRIGHDLMIYKESWYLFKVYEFKNNSSLFIGFIKCHLFVVLSDFQYSYGVTGNLGLAFGVFFIGIFLMSLQSQIQGIHLFVKSVRIKSLC
jgi:hypothetical protein